MLLALVKVVWVVSFTAWLIASAEGLAHPLLGIDPAELWWSWSQRVPLPLGPQGFRTMVLAAVHILVLALTASWWSQIHRNVAPNRRRRAGCGTWFVGGLVFLLVFVPLGIQPTLVAPTLSFESIRDRITNLVDGSAVFRALDAWLAIGRPVLGEPTPVRRPVDASAFNATLDSGSIPLMDRWDPLLISASGGDLGRFADTKAMMWVESSGKQYAVSPTGCSGLMQFCVSTAQRAPFRKIFGAGGVSACGCTDCKVPWSVQVALETDPASVSQVGNAFPCDLTDARFDAERSILAGAAFVEELTEDLDGNLLLAYIGYNAGPAVAKRLHKIVGGSATLDDIRPHLEPALRPYYGSRAPRMARTLLRINLPKLQRARQRFAVPSSRVLDSPPPPRAKLTPVEPSAGRSE